MNTEKINQSEELRLRIAARLFEFAREDKANYWTIWRTLYDLYINTLISKSND